MDTVCLSKSVLETCADNFNFFSYDSSTVTVTGTYSIDFSKIDGVLGLATTKNTEPNFMEELFATQDTESDLQVVSWNIGNNIDDNSFLFVGEQNTQDFEGHRMFVVDTTTTDASYWTVPVTGLSYDNGNIWDSMTKIAHLASGLPNIMLAASDYAHFSNAATIAGMTCDKESFCYSNTFGCDDLEDKMEDLVININNQNYEFESDDYLMTNLDTATYPDMLCYAAIESIPDSLGYYVLGETFFRQFYITMNYSDNSVWIAMPTDEVVEFTGLQIFGICFGVFIGLAVIAILIFVTIKKRNAKNEHYVSLYDTVRDEASTPLD